MTLKNIYRAQTNRFNLSDDVSTSEDDGGESGSNEVIVPCNHDEPLIPPRQKHKMYHVRGKIKTKSGNFTWIVCFILTIVCVVGVLLIVVDQILEQAHSGQKKVNTDHEMVSVGSNNSSLNIKPCSSFTSKEIWHHIIPKLMTETAIRQNDVNQDNVPDILIGFMTVLDGYFVDGLPRKACAIYFNGSFPCFGGILALDGRTGQELWRHYTIHEVFAVNCNADLDSDDVRDCLISGRVGVFEAISARHGTLLWRFDKDDPGYEEIMGIYTPQFVRDLDGDGVLDILATHGGDPLSEPNSEKRLVGKLFLFSGKTGNVLKWQNVPDNHETYFSPVVYSTLNGTDTALFGTGGETHPGALWAIDVIELYHGNINRAVAVYSDDYKGIMVPPVLADINKDGTVDIIMAMFNATVVAFDGETFEKIWEYSFPGSETYSTPAAGYFNDDDIPDFFVRYNHGKGFPLYYYSEVAVLDGRTGKPLTQPYFKSSVMSNASPLTISMTGDGNDAFVFWIADCVGNEGKGDWFDFVKGTNVHEQSRADTCKLRYNAKSFSRLSVMNRRTGFPGHTIYDSLVNEWLEHGLSPNEENSRKRRRRHVGPPDHGGFQRLIQTGSISATFSNNQSETPKGIDVMMVTYWMYPAKVRVITDKEKECIEHYRNLSRQGKFDNAVNITENFNEGNYDEGDAATNLCLKKKQDQETFYVSQKDYDFTSLRFGNLTVYRFRLECHCDLKPSETCSDFLPIDKQGWGGYMGTLGNSYFIPRYK